MNMSMTALKMVGLGFVAALAGTAANATAYDFNFKTNSTVGSSSYVDAGAGEFLQFSDTTNGSTLNLQVYGGHINDTKSGALNTVSTAVVADWRGYGLGVSFGNDNTQDETHQIDNGGDGTDFVALVFDKAVTLSNFGVTAFAMSGNSYIDYDLSYVAYAGTLADLVNGVNMSTFTNVNTSAPTSSATIGTTGGATSNIWLVSAAISSPDSRVDGFKLTSLAVTSVPAAVPEPATWAMMLVGFGAIGGTLRSRRGRPTMNAAIGG
jgi:hypothetical protein